MGVSSPWGHGRPGPACCDGWGLDPVHRGSPSWKQEDRDVLCCHEGPPAKGPSFSQSPLQGYCQEAPPQDQLEVTGQSLGSVTVFSKKPRQAFAAHSADDS